MEMLLKAVDESIVSITDQNKGILVGYLQVSSFDVQLSHQSAENVHESRDQAVLSAVLLLATQSVSGTPHISHHWRHHTQPHRIS